MFDFPVSLPGWLQWDSYLDILIKYGDEFIKNNYMSLGLIVGILKTVAIKSKNNTDNKIITFLGNFSSSLVSIITKFIVKRKIDG